MVESSLVEGEEGPIPSDSVKNEPPDDNGIQVLGLKGSNPPAVPRSFASRHDPAVARQLCEVYLQQVDPVIKILHRPSLNQWMVHGEPYLAYAEGHPSVEALGLAVCYSAVSSMTENQCSFMFHAKKADLAPSLAWPVRRRLGGQAYSPPAILPSCKRLSCIWYGPNLQGRKSDG